MQASAKLKDAPYWIATLVIFVADVSWGVIGGWKVELNGLLIHMLIVASLLSILAIPRFRQEPRVSHTIRLMTLLILFSNASAVLRCDLRHSVAAEAPRVSDDRIDERRSACRLRRSARLAYAALLCAQSNDDRSSHGEQRAHLLESHIERATVANEAARQRAAVADFDAATIFAARPMGTAKLEPEKSDRIAKFTPITLPLELNTGPPEPPCVVCAS